MAMMPSGGLACGPAAALRTSSSGAPFLMEELDLMGGPWIRRPKSRSKQSAGLWATASRRSLGLPAAPASIPPKLSWIGLHSLRLLESYICIKISCVCYLPGDIFPFLFVTPFVQT